MDNIQQQARLQQLLPQLFHVKEPVGKPYLYFQLLPTQSVLLPMDIVQESLLVPTSQITPIPNMPPAVLGLMASRSRVFVAVDLAQLLQCSPTTVTRQQEHVIVVRTADRAANIGEEEPLLALVVNRIQGTLRIDPEYLQETSGPILPTLMPFVSGVIFQDGQQMPILDIHAVARLPSLQAY